MSDRPDNRPDQTSKDRPRPLTDQPGMVDGIPVKELVRVTRELISRITNEDRKRVQAEAIESGGQIQSSTPFLLQQFFTGRIDLDIELARRFPNPPLVTPTSITPEPGKRARHGIAHFLGQDGAAGLLLEMHGAAGDLQASFLLSGMIAVNFTLGNITETQRKRFLDLMRHPNRIAFLWTRERWERDYMIFVVRDGYARVYAFGPNRYDAACRLTPEGLNQLLAWLRTFWITDTGNGDAPATPNDPKAEGTPSQDQQDSPSSAFSW